MIRISVIVPTRGDSRLLRSCLEALACAFPPDAEVIAVSDGGADIGPDLADLAGPLRLRCLRVPHGGPGWARNQGLAIARGDIIAFTDDDCLPRAGWLDALAARVSVGPPVAAGGVTFNGVPANAYADAAQLVLDMVARHERDCCGEVRFFPANNCAFPAAALRRLGGFDATFRTAEDRELLRRWRGAGYTTVLAPDAIVDHAADPGLVGYVRKFWGYGRGAARFHATANDDSWGDSLSFHRRLPVLAAPELKRRGPRRGAALAGLLALWEAANLGGFLAEKAGRLLRNGGRGGAA